MPTAEATQLRWWAWPVAVLVSRAGVALGLAAAPIVGLPALIMPNFMAAAFSPSPGAVAYGWVAFILIGVLWVWVFSVLRSSMPALTAALVTATLNWIVCGVAVLSTAPFWGPRVATGAVPAPGLFGIAWSPSDPWTLLVAFLLSVPGLLLL